MKQSFIKKLGVQKIKEEYIVTITFLILTIVCFFLANISFGFLVEQVIVRFIRNQILILALILPIVAGMGLNFAVIIGAMTAQIAYLIVLNCNIEGGIGVILVFGLTIVLAVGVGYILGRIMNIVKGREMVTTIVLGFLFNYIYQLIFMVGFGTVFTVNNSDLVLSSGEGVKNMVDLATYKAFFDNFGSTNIGGITISFLLIGIVLLMGFLTWYIMKTPFGQQVKALGFGGQGKPENIGIEVDKTRIGVMIISTVTAGIGQFVYLQNIGSLNVYTDHMNVDTLTCAALLAGGATIKEAKVRHAFLGVFLMHSLFILSPLAGQFTFSNVALGEYFRSFIVYGVIAFALVMNIRIENKKKNKMSE